MPFYILCILSNSINILFLFLLTLILILAITIIIRIAFNSIAFSLNYFCDSFLNRIEQFLYNKYTFRNK